MSHFTAIVITNNTHTKGKRKANELASFDPENEIEDLLAPFDENWKAPPRPEDCYCLEMDASQHTKSGTDWGKAGEAMTDCEDCNGSGTSVTTYNPESKWDWYQVGGRWEGELVEGYNANDAIRNYEKCSYCEGTGLRNDEIGNERRAEDPDWGCNGCHISYAEGKTAKLPNGKPALGMKRTFGNAPTGTNVAFMKDIAKAFTPFAFVTPRFEWLQTARMGWWAQTTDDNGEYEKQWEDARKTYGDHVAVLVDCHI